MGTLKTFTKPGDTGKSMHRRFRPECGSGVIDKGDGLPGVVMVNVGTLDDRSWVKPRSEIFCDSAQPRVKLDGEFGRFGKMPG